MPRLLLLNNAILMACCSIYLGTGISLVFFQFPVEPFLTPDNYALIFVGSVQRATEFFTWMTILMLITGFIMLVTEWFSGLRWVPIIVLAALIASTLLTTQFIFVYNDRLAAGITNPAELADVFSRWATLNRIRVSLWVVEWLAMMGYFFMLGLRARADK